MTKRRWQPVLISSLLAVFLGVPTNTIAASEGTSQGQARLANGGTVAWSEIATENTLQQTVDFYDQSGGRVYEVRFYGTLNDQGEVNWIEISIGDESHVGVDPADAESGRAIHDFATPYASTDLPDWLAVAEDAMSPILIRRNLGKLRAAIGAVTANGGYGDCYRECVEDERKKCNDDCDSKSALNPCNSICYISVSTGCAIGCL